MFRSSSYHDGTLGQLRRSAGRWNGTITLGSQGEGEVELRLAGNRKAPDPACIALAHQLPGKFDALKPSLESALFEHYEPYQEAASDGALPEREEPFPRLERAEDVWTHVSLTSILIEPLPGSPAHGPTIEIAFAVGWDEEHTVGARIQDWRLFELCGSV